MDISFTVQKYKGHWNTAFYGRFKRAELQKKKEKKKKRKRRKKKDNIGLIQLARMRSS